jgi:hypothetical protein
MAQLCFGVGIEEEGPVKLRRGEKRGTRSLSWVCDGVFIAMRFCLVCVCALYVKNRLLSVSRRSGCTF